MTLNYSFLSEEGNKKNKIKDFGLFKDTSTILPKEDETEKPKLNKNIQALSKQMQSVSSSIKNSKDDNKGSFFDVQVKEQTHSKCKNGEDKEECEEDGEDGEEGEKYEEDDASPPIEAFQHQQGTNKSYYIPYYNNVANEQSIDGVKDQMMDKLNYLIHILEEQQNDRTDQVTEELILYCFLGVFIIFLVDSFVRVGKYTR